MAYKNREVQPELFNTIQKKQKQNLLSKNIFSDHYRSSFSVSCDTLIVIIIALLMVNLSSFAIGLEKGKSQGKTAEENGLNKNQKRLIVEEKAKEVKLVSEVAQKSKEETELKITEAKKTVITEISKKGYIIQLVTYSNNSYADKEAEKLRAQGYQSYVLKSGEYFVVYSGIYDSKIAAKENLPVLKKRYKDCFVRFLQNT